MLCVLNLFCVQALCDVFICCHRLQCIGDTITSCSIMGDSTNAASLQDVIRVVKHVAGLSRDTNGHQSCGTSVIKWSCYSRAGSDGRTVMISVRTGTRVAAELCFLVTYAGCVVQQLEVGAKVEMVRFTRLRFSSCMCTCTMPP